MKRNLLYTLLGLGIIAFCFLPSCLENCSFLVALSIIGGALALLLCGARVVNAMEERR